MGFGGARLIRTQAPHVGEQHEVQVECLEQEESGTFGPDA